MKPTLFGSTGTTLLAGGILWRAVVLSGAALVAIGCGGAMNSESAWPDVSKKWHDRAVQSLAVGDVDDAELAAEHGLRVDQNRPEMRLVAAKVALSRLEFDRAIQLTEGLSSSEALGVRGRALWYSDRIAEAAAVLEQMLADPEVRDPWAVDIAKVARRGIGRKPFTITGGMLGVSEMPRVGRSLLVPVELDGEPVLAMVATGVSETVVDATAGAEPKWVSLRFGERVEVKDVPALTKDLSLYSRQVNAPLKVLLGVNLLRRLHPTFDLLGSQFVVRTFDPPPPAGATIVPVNYVRGGGMLVRVALGDQTRKTLGSTLIDTVMDFPMALDEGGWKKLGRKPSELTPIPGARGMSHGTVGVLTLGTLDIPDVPAIHGIGIADIEKSLSMDLDGIIGSGLLAPFRVTLVDGGRTAWFEPAPIPVDVDTPVGPEQSPVPAPAANSAGAPDSTPPATAPRTTLPTDPTSPSSNAPAKR